MGNDLRTLDTPVVADALSSLLIQWRCQRPEHVRTDDAGRVFLHDGAWAYCDAGRLASDHQFLRTGGVSIRRLDAAFGRTKPSR